MLLHRLRQQGGTHLAGFGRFNRFSEKNPQMCTVSAAGDLHRAGDIAFTSRLYSHCDVCTPVFFIKINGEETAGFILKQRINAQHSFSTEVRFDSAQIPLLSARRSSADVFCGEGDGKRLVLWKSHKIFPIPAGISLFRPHRLCYNKKDVFEVRKECFLW